MKSTIFFHDNQLYSFDSNFGSSKGYTVRVRHQVVSQVLQNVFWECHSCTAASLLPRQARGTPRIFFTIPKLIAVEKTKKPSHVSEGLRECFFIFLLVATLAGLAHSRPYVCPACVVLAKEMYRVTHQVVPNVLLTSKQKSRFSIRGIYWNATFILMSELTDWSPCKKPSEA